MIKTNLYIIEIVNKDTRKKDVQQESWETILVSRFYRFKTMESTLGERILGDKPTPYVELNLRRPP